MKRIVQLIVLTFCVTTFLTGCDQQMTKPVMDVISPTQSHIEKARTAMENVNQRRTEVHQKAEEAGDFFTVFIDSEVIFKEELGLRKGLWVELVQIYRDENPEDSSVLDGYNKLQVAFAKKLEEGTLGMSYFDYIRTFDPLIVEYLRLSYVYPDMQEAGLLVRFRGSIREGKVTIVFPENF